MTGSITPWSPGGKWPLSFNRSPDVLSDFAADFTNDQVSLYIQRRENCENTSSNAAFVRVIPRDSQCLINYLATILFT